MVVLLDFAIATLKISLKHKHEFKDELILMRQEVELCNDIYSVFVRAITTIYLQEDAEKGLETAKKCCDEIGVNVYLIKRISTRLIEINRWEEAFIYLTKGINIAPKEPGLM